MRAGASGLNLTRPPGNGSDPDTSLIEVTLISLERTVTVEEIRFVPPLLMGAVIGSENHQGIIINPKFFQQVKNPAHVLIHMLHHRRKCRHGVCDNGPAILSGHFFKLRKFFPPGSNSFFR